MITGFGRFDVVPKSRSKSVGVGILLFGSFLVVSAVLRLCGGHVNDDQI